MTWDVHSPTPAAAKTPPTIEAKAFASDPTGDNFGAGTPQHDITSLSADVANNMLVVTINFAGQISPPNSGRADALVGFVDFDTDGNTGETASDLNLFGFCPSNQQPPLGTDYYVFLFSGSTSSAAVANFDTDSVVGSASSSYGSNSLTLSVPLSTIGAGAASIKIAVVLGTGLSGPNEPNDCAPNSTALIAGAAAVGPPVLVSGTTQAGSTLTFRSPVNGVRYDWDFDADGVIDRTGTANALNVTYPGAYSGNVAVLTTDANGGRTISNMTIGTAAPKLTAALNGSAAQACGDGDGSPEPGETWNVPVRVTNQGNATSSSGSAIFAAKDRVDAAASGQAIEGKLIVNTPSLDVGTLGPGASMTGTVSVTLDGTAACGSSLGLLFNGGVDAVSSNAGSGSALSTFNIPSTCQRYTGSCTIPLATAKALVTPRQGLYFNVNRSGNGLSNFVIPVTGQAPVYFGAWFTAAADHTPTWYIVQGALVGNVAVGPIYRFTKNPGSTFAVTAAVVGQAVVTLKSAEQIAFLWQIGPKFGVELMNYLTPGPVPSPNRTGAWYNTSESGWGQVVHQFVSGGNNTFVVDYLYDAAGEPRWVLTQGSDAAVGAGVAHQTFQVHCPGCPWIADWNNFPLQAGTGSDQFTDAFNGRTTTSFTLPSPLAGSWTKSNLPITILTVPQ